jgi:hypothetical protein
MLKSLKQNFKAKDRNTILKSIVNTIKNKYTLTSLCVYKNNSNLNIVPVNNKPFLRSDKGFYVIFPENTSQIVINVLKTLKINYKQKENNTFKINDKEKKENLFLFILCEAILDKHLEFFYTQKNI